VSTSRPLVFDAYGRNRATGSFILVDPSTHFTAGAGMVTGVAGGATGVAGAAAPLTAAERLARAAREAGSDAEAVEAVRHALEEILT
jgi:bifunctional enzyme CysN/CysC